MKYAHKRDDGEMQSIKEHLDETADLAEENAVEMFKPIARAVGLAHDIGKYADAFQERLNGSSKKFEHSACGAIEYKEIFEKSNDQTDKIFAAMIEFCIACHHTGLQNGGNVSDTPSNTVEATMNSRISSEHKKAYSGDWDYSDYKEEIKLDKPDFRVLCNLLQQEKSAKDRIELYAFFTRYLFSCLVDADFINTEGFCSEDVKRELSDDSDYSNGFNAASKNLEKRLTEFQNKTELQKARSRIQMQAYENSSPTSVSILNMPTGSGKTLCSLKLALDKINAGKSKKRIIYVIPYTGIIDQTAREFDKIFNGSVPILQHHSNYFPDGNNDDISTADKLKLACENWDAPFIITTAVQFFQSFYECRTSALRKVHNMADSVIVFDEIHTLPENCIQPCLRAVGYITEYLNSEAIFLSATMPDYSRLFEKYAPKCKITHLIKDKSDFQYFKKVDYINLGKTDYESVAEKANLYSSSLIIVNSKKSAQKVYGLLNGNKYHLSTYMTPADRKKTIDNIKRDLENNVNITVVSTSLIEAGIDLDFETVFREINGLDSILQAGGRCNREGIRDRGKVFIFETDSSFNKLSENYIKISTAKRLLEKYNDITASECIEEYYNNVFFFNKNTIENNTIAKDKDIPANIAFKDYAENFKLIKDDSVGVVIPQNDECKKMLETLRSNVTNRRMVLRSLQQYTVPLKCRGNSCEFDRALDARVIYKTDYGIYILSDMNYYDINTGLDIDKSNDLIL